MTRTVHDRCQRCGQPKRLIGPRCECDEGWLGAVQSVRSGDLVRRLGRFKISGRLLYEQPEQLKPLFAEMIVVEAQMRWEHSCVEYLAMSERFEVLPEGLVAPLYEITFRRDDDGRVTSCEVAKA